MSSAEKDRPFIQPLWWGGRPMCPACSRSYRTVSAYAKHWDQAHAEANAAAQIDGPSYRCPHGSPRYLCVLCEERGEQSDGPADGVG